MNIKLKENNLLKNKSYYQNIVEFNYIDSFKLFSNCVIILSVLNLVIFVLLLNEIKNHQKT